MPSEPDAGAGGAEPGCDPRVYSGSLSVTHQDGLEDLRGVTVLDGTLTLGGDVSDLSPLACLKTIKGKLQIIDATRLSSLDGLGSLSYVGLQLQVMRNPSLLSLSGLRSLREAVAVLISENPLLESVVGVGVKAAEWRVADNDALESLSGLEDVEEGVFWIEGNDRLATLDGCAACAGGGSTLSTTTR
ncbi:hypothetical protein BE20_20265 [Sorangium cellulosum]|nr:hypothetical protein BE20_20265 [Sorangium cellulosum]